MKTKSIQDIEYLREAVTVVIRTVGERTEHHCRALLQDIFPEQHIFTIHETPFSEAIRKAFSIAMAQNRTWTLIIDADVLVDSTQIAQLIQKARIQEEHIFQIQGLILDKFIPVRRPAGNHLYRTSLLGKALPLIPVEGTSLRPETDMLNAMAQRGHPWVQSNLLVGIHDFEQFHADIFRKCFLHAHKHDYLHAILRTYWQSQAATDQDFQVALLGFNHGKAFAQTVLVDKSFLQAQVAEVLLKEGIQEKSTAIINIPVTDIIQAHTDSPFQRLHQHTIYPVDFELKYFDRSSLRKKSYLANLAARIIRFITRWLRRLINLSKS